MLNVHEVVDHDGKALRSPDLFHPGCILKEEIESREIAKKDFARLLNILPTHLSEIFTGKRPVSVRLARRLELALDISAGFWLRMQADYDLKAAEEQVDPALVRIEDIVRIQEKDNTTLSKAIIAYDKPSGDYIVGRHAPRRGARLIIESSRKSATKNTYSSKVTKAATEGGRHLKKK